MTRRRLSGIRHLSGLDAAFLYTETVNAPLNLMAAIVLESESPQPGADYERVRFQLENRLPSLPRLREKVVEVPLGLDHPVWVEDGHFDLDDHLHRTALRPPSDDRALARYIARFAETPLRRDRPLWEFHVVEGLSGGRVAVVMKLHHAAADGIGGVDVLARLLDVDPDGKELVPANPRERRSEPEPSARELLGDALASLGTRRWRAVQHLARGAGAMARTLVSPRFLPLPPPAPATRINGAVSGRRSVAIGSVSLDDVKAIKRRFAATVNHVVLAGCAGALREYLSDEGEVPSQPLVAAVPMAVDRPGDASNALSVLLVELPVHLDRARDRLAASREASLEAMRRHETTMPQLSAWADLATPALFAGASQIYHRLGLAARHAPFLNVVISNVPGPRDELWCAGARVVSCHPFGPIYDGWGLNLTVMSYAGRVGIGAVACPERVPDVERIPRAFEASIRELGRVAGAVA